MRILTLLLTIILSLSINTKSLTQQCPAGGAAFINEFSGSSNLEYIELVVIGDPSAPTDPVDLEGWILDDNNIAQTGQGTASGHFILGDCFDAMAPGSIIVVYNADFPHPSIVPGFPNGDGAYVIPHSDPCITICTSNPNTSNSSYIPCGSAGYEGWSDCVGLSNNGDGVQIRKPDATFYHGLYYDTNFGPAAEDGCLDVGNIESSLNCGDWYVASNFVILPNTPGSPNSSINTTLIDNIIAGNLDCDDIDAACTPQACPEIEAITLISPVCSGQNFDVTATGLNDMALTDNGQNDFGINFILFDGGSEPADPYSGGTSLGTVPHGSLTGSDPDQSASINTSISTAGTYQICAILDPISNVSDCQPYACETIEINQAPVAEFSGFHKFCPGDCHKISLVILGGSEPYDVTFAISVGPINYSFTVDSYDVDDQTAICYAEGGIFPSYDPLSNTLTIPDIFTLTATLTVSEIIDANGCVPDEVDPNFVTIELNDSPEITPVDDYTLCDEDGDGVEWFDLESLNTQLNGGSGTTVLWYEDANGSIVISSPANYLSGDATVYASLYDEDCPSDTLAVNLIVLPISYPGEDAEVEICNEDNSILDFELILGGEDGGEWLDEDGSGVDLDDPSNVNFTGIAAGIYLFSYSFPANEFCPESIAFLTVTVQEVLSAGEDNDSGICHNSPTLIDLMDLLGSGADPSGDWVDLSGSGVNLSDPTQVDFSSIDIGSYQFEYTVENTNACEDQSAVITIFIYAEPNPGNDNSIEICSNTGEYLDLESALGSYDFGGYWIDEDLSGVDLSDPSTVDFNGIAPGIYNFTYIIPEVDGCPEASATITVTILEGISAGEDGIFQICMGNNESINLFSIINGFGDENGNWTQIAGNSIDLSDPYNLDFSTALSGNYSFLYEISSPCMIDSSLATVEIVESAFAGLDTIVQTCPGQDTFNLELVLGTFDTGGYWTDGIYSIISDVDSILIDTSATLFYYIIPAVSGCEADSASLTFLFDDAPEAGKDSTIFVCQGNNWVQNLFDLIPGVMDSTGIWMQVSGEIKDISDPRKVVFTDVPVEIDSFLYVVTNNCGIDSSYAVIEVGLAPNAGNDYSLQLCSDFMNWNLFDSLHNYTIGGNWLYLNGNSVSNPENLDISQPGSYDFMYVIPASGSCESDTAYAQLNIIEAPNAGVGTTLTYCEGHSESINLFSLLSGDPMSGGAWNANPAISDPENIDISNYPADDYIFEYIVYGDPNSICQNDTSWVLLQLKEAPNAGSDSYLLLCNESLAPVNLDDLLGQHDLNGYWIDQQNSGVDLSDSTEVDFNSIAPGIYNFTYVIEAQNSCPETQATVTIELVESQNAGSDHQLEFCEGEVGMINLWDEMDPDISTDGKWVYYGPDDLDLSSPSLLNLSGLNPGDHILWYIINENGPCPKDSSSLSINIDQKLLTGTCDTLFICNGPNDSAIDFLAALNGNDDGGQFRELTSSGVLLSDPTNVNFNDVLEGRYIFEYYFPENGNCPEQSTRIYIDVFPSYEKEITTAICPGEILQIGNNNYDINNLMGEETLQSINGCDSIIHVNLAIREMDITVDITDANCHGFGVISIENATSNEFPIVLDNVNLGLIQIDAIPYLIENVEPGSYLLNFEDSRTCLDSEQVNIQEFIGFNSDLEEEITIQEGESYQIDFNTDINAEMISWWPTDDLSCFNCLDPVASPKTDTEYIVTLIDKDDCILTDTIMIRVLKDSKVYLPNAFSPNSDAFNPIFYALSNANQGYYNMRIFDRWGEEVFHIENASFNDPGAGWDGKFKDKLLNPGVYVYLIESYFPGKEKQVLAGDVLLLR